MGLEISMDRQSVDNFNKQIEYLRSDGKRSLFSAIVKVGQRIRTTAMLRLQAQNHVVTSRLKNSIFVKAKKQNEINAAVQQSDQYSDNIGNVYDADLKSVTLFEDEIAVGSNVEYSTKIEVMDSYLYWAVKNTDMSRTVAELMKEEMNKRPKGGRKK